MRSLVAPAIAVACGHAPSSEPLENRVTAPPASALPECRARGNIAAVGGSRDYPVLVLYERGGWALGLDVASLAVWSDGSIVFKEDSSADIPRLLEAKLDAEAARSLVAATLARVRDLPAFIEIENATDEPAVEIIVRDRDDWRDVVVSGLYRDVPKSSVPPAWQSFFAVYHELLAERPKHGTPVPTLPPSERPGSLADGYPAFRYQYAIELVSSCARARRSN